MFTTNLIINLKQIKLKLNSNGDQLTIDASLGRLNNKDSLLLKNTIFAAQYNDANKFNFTLTSSTDTLANRADLNGKLGYTLKRVELELENSNLFVNNKQWTFLPNNK